MDIRLIDDIYVLLIYFVLHLVDYFSRRLLPIV